MKFIIENVALKAAASSSGLSSAARAGVLEVRSSRPLIETPGPLLGSRGGAVPHLTNETLQFLDIANSSILLPFQVNNILHLQGLGNGIQTNSSVLRQLYANKMFNFRQFQMELIG